MKKKIKLKPGDRICPKCGSDWDGGSILETMISQSKKMDSHLNGKTVEEIEAYMKELYSEPFRWGREIGIEIQGKYDGISYIQCPDCDAIFDRWTGEEAILPENKIEI